MDAENIIWRQACGIEEYLIRTRRQIHRYAEVNGTEHKTNALIRAELDRAGIPYSPVADTALIARLDSGRPGPSIVLRADMDALPIRENPNNLAGPRVCRSEQENTCHACGHDSHTAMLLGSMKLLTQMKDELCGTVYFCFEQGEECGGSVEQMIGELSKLPIGTCWGMHVNPDLDAGRISVDAGPRMAGGAGVDILVRGKGGHGSRPDLSINPVFAAAAIVTGIPGAFVNQLSPENPVTFGVTTIEGGGAANIFADTASIRGSLRFFNDAQGEKAVEIVKNVASHTAAMHRCRVEFGERMRVFGGPVLNDVGCAALAARALAARLPEGTVASTPKLYCSESFGRYLRMAPGVMAFLGIRNPAVGSGANLHNEFFDIDESVMKIGVTATVSYALAYMREHARG